MKKQGNEITRYMDGHGWKKISDGGTAGIYSNGTLYVFSDGTGWIASKSPDQQWRWARYFGDMLKAMQFADSKMPTRSKAEAAAQARYDARKRKVTIRLDAEADADLIAAIEAQPSMQAYIKELIRKDLQK